MHGALWFRVENIFINSGNFQFIGNYYLSLPFFSSRAGAEPDILLPHEARGELILSWIGKGGILEAVFSSDHTFDEVAFVTPHPTTVLQAGIRFRSL